MNYTKIAPRIESVNDLCGLNADLSLYLFKPILRSILLRWANRRATSGNNIEACDPPHRVRGWQWRRDDGVICVSMTNWMLRVDWLGLSCFVFYGTMAGLCCDFLAWGTHLAWRDFNVHCDKPPIECILAVLWRPNRWHRCLLTNETTAIERRTGRQTDWHIGDADNNGGMQFRNRYYVGMEIKRIKIYF